MKNSKYQDLGKGGLGIEIVNRVIRSGLTKKLIFEQSQLDIGEIALQVERIIPAKTLG